MLRRYLYICVVTSCLAFGQQTEKLSSKDPAQEERAGAPNVTISPDNSPTSAPGRAARRLHQHPPTAAPRVIPRSQYSPLAAAGGYAPRGVSPWQAIVNYFNPRHLNMGQIFAERKQAWLDNALYNQYFWYSFWVTALLIFSWFAIAWVHNDRVRETWELAEFAADAVGYAEYCKRAAKEAITRYNEHVETCNRVIESNTSGLVTPETAHLQSFKQQIEQLTTEKQAAEFKIGRLTEELKSKDQAVAEITSRLSSLETQLTERPKDASGTAPPGLVERINRLESVNRALKEENQRIRQQQRQTKPRTAAAEELQPAE